MTHRFILWDIEISDLFTPKWNFFVDLFCLELGERCVSLLCFGRSYYGKWFLEFFGFRILR